MNKVNLYIILIIGSIYLFNKYYNKNTGIILKDHVEGRIEDKKCEEKPINSDYKKAWTEEHLSKNTKYYSIFNYHIINYE